MRQEGGGGRGEGGGRRGEGGGGRGGIYGVGFWCSTTVFQSVWSQQGKERWDRWGGPTRVHRGMLIGGDGYWVGWPADWWGRVWGGSDL